MDALANACIRIAREAGEAILSIAARARTQVMKKADNSPVTEADQLADDIITAALTALTPSIPVISEEGDAQNVQERRGWSQCWLVDPLDGTRGFVDGSGQYTVNIALIDQHMPVLGVIYMPEADVLYVAHSGQAWKQVGQQCVSIHARTLRDTDQLKIAVSQYHGAGWIDRFASQLPHNAEMVRMNSSMKLCLVAEGSADIYPRVGPTSEWDTAAGQCIVEAAGGVVVDLEGKTLQYNARDTLINPSFAVIGDATQQSQFLTLIHEIRSAQ